MQNRRVGQSVQQSATEALGHFIRRTLGCRCPDEVFSSIDIRPLPAPRGNPPCVRLEVGKRLLVYVIAAGTASDLPALVAGLTTAGRADRDAGGLNRLRLVLHSASGNPEERRSAEEAFVQTSRGDDRTHLHWISSDALPPQLAAD